MPSTFETVAYGGWDNCIELRHGSLRLVATTDVGPRIIFLGLDDGPNILKNYDDQLGLTGGDTWRIYGGHRLWHAPEADPRTYAPDNAPVAHSIEGDTLVLRAAPEKTTGIEKRITVAAGTDGQVQLTHHLTNRGLWPIETAPWTPTVMAPGGRAVLPQEPFAPHPEALLPARPLVLWSYTRMNDARWTWGDRQIVLRQDSQNGSPQKIGALNTLGWVAFVTDKYLFLKRFAPDVTRTHVDFGCNTELFTDKEMLEVETVAPLQRLNPGATASHIEDWYLVRAHELDVLESRSELDLSALAEVL